MNFSASLLKHVVVYARPDLMFPINPQTAQKLWFVGGLHVYVINIVFVWLYVGLMSCEGFAFQSVHEEDCQYAR